MARSNGQVWDADKRLFSSSADCQRPLFCLEPRARLLPAKGLFPNLIFIPDDEDEGMRESRYISGFRDF